MAKTAKNASKSCPAGSPIKADGKLRKGWRYSKSGKPVKSKACR